MKRSTGADAAFDIVNITLCVLIIIVILYPLVFVVNASISDPMLVLQGKVLFLPKDITLNSYSKIFSYPEVLTGYRNSLVYTVVGTTVNLVLTICGAYTLSRKDLFGRNAVTMIFAFTMFFNGGLIPTYLVVSGLGLLDSMWALILPTAVTMYNLIVMRTFFQNQIPEELHEAAFIDGCSSLGILIRIVLPLSKAIIAVILLFYAVAHWNEYFSALIYLNDRNRYPLQIILREILLLSQVQELVDTQGFEEQLVQTEGIKYALIIVASVPVLILYPFIQKYFVRGVMIGAVKG